jgi:hypothetical protein
MRRLVRVDHVLRSSQGHLAKLGASAVRVGEEEAYYVGDVVI